VQTVALAFHLVLTRKVEHYFQRGRMETETGYPTVGGSSGTQRLDKMNKGAAHRYPLVKSRRKAALFYLLQVF
jgi:hypothetical protein